MTRRLFVCAVTVLLLGASVLVGAVPQVALAGPGSRIAGVVWADTNRDGLRGPSETVQTGVSVELLGSPGGNVVATTTSAAGGAYAFANVADGSYTVRVTAPGAFTFPATAGGDNDFASTGTPAPGQPARGTSGVVTVVGASQTNGVDAGMRPVGNITVARLPMPDACEGLASTGTTPFNAGDGNGQDSTASNCLVRTGDTVRQNYSVSLTGLPTGVSVNNVIAEFRITSSDGGNPRLAGPGPSGLPVGCLTQGVTPSSTVVNNADGSVTVRCNLGTFASGIASVQLVYSPESDSANGSHLRVEMSASAAGGDAGLSNTVAGPDVEVTGLPQWDLRKVNYSSETQPVTETIAGQSMRGYVLSYRIELVSTATSQRGQMELDQPVTFTDKLSDFPNAMLRGCRPTTAGTDGFPPSAIPTCPPQGTPMGANGWPISFLGYPFDNPNQAVFRFVLTVFVPEADVVRVLDPDWQPGDALPSGSVPVANMLIDTDGWTSATGEPNNGTGFEPGWDGAEATGNNVVNNSPLRVGVVPPVPAPGLPGSGKAYVAINNVPVNPLQTGKVIGSRVLLATNAVTTVPDPVLCDVFDVSVYRLVDAAADPAGRLCHRVRPWPERDEPDVGSAERQRHLSVRLVVAAHRRLPAARAPRARGRRTRPASVPTGRTP